MDFERTLPGRRINFRDGTGRRAFTLAELLVSMVLLIIIVGLVAQMTSQTSQIWRNSMSRIQTFQEARGAFESMTRNLSQATLNTYYDYYDGNTPRSLFAPLSNFIPTSYDRVSELHFISGQAATLLNASPTPLVTQTQGVFFQAPLGYSASYQELDNALNACGYFLQFDAAANSVPALILDTPGYKPRYRFRLMEMIQPTENLSVYPAPTTAAQNKWFTDYAAIDSRVIAENVIALALLPKLSQADDPTGVALAPAFNYNSRIPLGATSDPAWPSASPAFPGDQFAATTGAGATYSATRHNQLPPLMRVVMVVISETSALHLQGNSTTVPAAINLSQTGLFTDATKLDSDIQAVTDICNATPGNLTGNTQRLTYRIFTSDVIMRDAKWSNK